MQVFSPARPRARSTVRRVALLIAPWLIGAGTASGQIACEPIGNCETRDLAAAGVELAVPLIVPDGTGGGRRDTMQWSSQMNRHDFVLGRVNADHDDDYQYRLPYGAAISYPVLQGYGSKFSHRGSEHFTVDFQMDVGTPVHAAREGVVALIEDSHEGACWTEGCGRLANFVVVLHRDGTTGEYFHLERGSVAVSVGEPVRRGQLLARSGNTGYTTLPHLHFGVYRAEPNGQTRSIAVRFLTRKGPIGTPRTGARYLNAD